MKCYAVLLFDNAALELDKPMGPWLRRQEGLAYLCAPRIDPSGPYFTMWLNEEGTDGEDLEFELQIPHAFVKAVLYTTDIKRLGFLGRGEDSGGALARSARPMQGDRAAPVNP